MNIGTCRQYGSLASKNVPNTTKKNRTYQLVAANMFSAWGEVLANKFEIILAQNKTIEEENEWSVEDFFDDGKLNLL
jgi:hypothetical protein